MNGQILWNALKAILPSFFLAAAVIVGVQHFEHRSGIAEALIMFWGCLIYSQILVVKRAIKK